MKTIFNNERRRRKIVITGTGRVSRCLHTYWGRKKADVMMLSHADTNAGLFPELTGFIVHAGARVFADLSAADPAAYFQDNVVDTFNLLERARRMVPKVSFIYISTVEAEFPNNPYAASKAAAEVLVRAYNRTYNLNAVILRVPNLFLPEFDTKGFVGKLMTGEITEAREPTRKRKWIEGEEFAERVYTYIRRKLNRVEVVKMPAERYTDQEIVDTVIGFKQGIRVRI